MYRRGGPQLCGDVRVRGADCPRVPTAQLRFDSDFMHIIEKLPGLTDDHLKNLLANARRLEREGVPDLQRSATELLPLIDAEIAARKAAKGATRKKRTVKAR